MINIDAHNHVKGKSIYLDDIQELQGTLYALPFDATVAHAKIVSINLESALKVHGIETILTAKDIPGENQIGGIIPQTVLLHEISETLSVFLMGGWSGWMNAETGHVQGQ